MSDEPGPEIVVNLPGVLLRAAETCRLSDNSHLESPLKELLEHLRLLREDNARITRFFQLYVDDRA